MAPPGQARPDPRCGEYHNRGVTVDGVVLRDGAVLLVRRGSEPFRGAWALPGGWVDHDETVPEAAAREVREELGVATARVGAMVGLYSDPARHPAQAIDVAYLVEIDGEPRAGSDAEEVRWFGLDELPDLAFDHAAILRAARAMVDPPTRRGQT